jgi:hypothetical protein
LTFFICNLDIGAKWAVTLVKAWLWSPSIKDHSLIECSSYFVDYKIIWRSAKTQIMLILKVARISNFYCLDSFWLKYAPPQVLAIKPNDCGAGMIKLLFNIFTDVKYLAILKVARISNFFHCSDSLWLKYVLRQVLAIKPNKSYHLNGMERGNLMTMKKCGAVAVIWRAKN